MIMCSGISSQCLEPFRFNTYNNFYDCMVGGYEEALKKTKEIGSDEINKNKIYIKFFCTSEEVKEKKLDT